MRNLKEDKAMIEDFIAMMGESTYAEPIALHAIDRAMTAEIKLELAVKTLRDIGDSAGWGLRAHVKQALTEIIGGVE